jgi:hypothetical protein
VLPEWQHCLPHSIPRLRKRWGSLSVAAGSTLIGGITDVFNVGVTSDGFPWVINAPTTVRRGLP